MAYTRGNSSNIIVGAAAIFVSKEANGLGDSTTSPTKLPGTVAGESYKTTLADRNQAVVRNVGYTSNGLDLTFTPTFGDVQVDQLLDTARLFKSGMTVTLRTSLAEATLENLLMAITQKYSTVNGTAQTAVSWSDTGASAAYITTQTVANGTSTAAVNTSSGYLDILSGDLGEYPVERGLVAVGPGTVTAGGTTLERIYVAYKAVSIQNVTVSAKRDAATMFDVEFRLLPDSNGAYGKIIDRTFA
jgi:hypothetical protein